MAELAREEGLRRPTMSWALVKPHERANRVIARFLDVPLHELWPEWFDRQGNLISSRPLNTNTPRVKAIMRGAHRARPSRQAA